MKSYEVLVIEDEQDIREGIRILLKGEGYSVKEAASGDEALNLINDSTDLIILDIVLPDIPGLKVCEEIRNVSTAPILLISVRTDEEDKYAGFAAGADDYLAKPFSFAELSARVRALLRRYYVYMGKNQTRYDTSVRDQMLTVGRFRIGLEHNEVFKDDREIDLTGTEYGILLLLLKNPGRTFSSQDIYESVWNEPYTYTANSTIMVHIRKLRTKIEDDPKNPVFIRNIWGKGYRYEAEQI